MEARPLKRTVADKALFMQTNPSAEQHVILEMCPRQHTELPHSMLPSTVYATLWLYCTWYISSLSLGIYGVSNCCYNA